MKEKKLYECEICHTEYADKEKAKECEKSHQRIEDANIDAQYKPISMEPFGIPYRINVKFKNGKYITYNFGFER